jgi:membrane-bound ClpP family serine protease
MKRVRKDIPGKVYLRYALLNLPGAIVLVGILLVVRSYLHLPGWAIAAVVAAWVSKDVILFPFIWRSYDGDRPGLSRTMTGSIGVVKQALAPEGFVQINGELWKAEAIDGEKVIDRGATVRVVSRIGLTVQVALHESNRTSDKEYRK